jgi:3-hydroxybutyryl-CoA dehydrogenase
MGMHFMNPVPVIPLVELIKNPYTSAATAQAVTHLVSSIEKTPVYSMDSPGFIVNRILIPMIHEAILLLEQGIGTKEDIDIAMRLGTNQPIGPLALADLIGLDTCLAIMQVLEKELKSLKYAPCALLISMVEKGLLGRKVGQGFYPYKK